MGRYPCRAGHRNYRQWYGAGHPHDLPKKQALKQNYQKVIYTILCGLAIASLAYFIDRSTFGSGKEIMQTTLFTEHKRLAWFIPILRVIGPIISFSTGAAGGIFTPYLSAGASIGAVFAGLFHLLPAETNLIILCGMTGFLTGITRSPFTSSILVIEMTNSHNVIFYLMLTALLANLISNAITTHPFYDHLKDQYIHELYQAELPEHGKLAAAKEIP